jgi:hypothetical protein
VSVVLEENHEIAVLREKAEQVRELIAPEQAGKDGRPESRPAAEAEGTRAEWRWEWYRRLEDAVLDLSNALPEGTEDYDARKLFEFQVGLRRAIDADPTATDQRGEVQLAMLRMADVARRIGRRLEHSALDDPRAAADFIFATLRGIGVMDLSRLLGVSSKTVNAWKAGGPVTRNAARIVVLAQVLTYLRASMTPVGLVMWFDAPRHQLGGSTPLELLGDDQANAREQLLWLARGARGQLAS